MQLAIYCNQELAQSSTYNGTFLNEKESDNQFLINIPIYQNSQSTKVYAWATMLYEKGTKNLYNTNDIVVVDFINSQLNYPIIIGKLYQTSENTNSTINIEKQISSLIVSKEANFKNYLGFKLGDITGADLINTVELIKYQSKLINILQEDLKITKEKLKNIENKLGI